MINPTITPSYLSLEDLLIIGRKGTFEPIIKVLKTREYKISTGPNPDKAVVEEIADKTRLPITEIRDAIRYYTYSRREELIREGLTDKKLVEIIAEELGLNQEKMRDRISTSVYESHWPANLNNLRLNPHTSQWKAEQARAKLIIEKLNYLRENCWIIATDAMLTGEIAGELSLDKDYVEKTIRNSILRKKIKSVYEAKEKIFNTNLQERIKRAYEQLGEVSIHQASPRLAASKEFIGLDGKYLTAFSIKKALYNALNVKSEGSPYSQKEKPAFYQSLVEVRGKLMQQGLSEEEIIPLLAKIAKPGEEEKLEKRIKRYFQSRRQDGTLDPDYQSGRIPEEIKAKWLTRREELINRGHYDLEIAEILKEEYSQSAGTEAGQKINPKQIIAFFSRKVNKEEIPANPNKGSRLYD